MCIQDGVFNGIMFISMTFFNKWKFNILFVQDI